MVFVLKVITPEALAGSFWVSAAVRYGTVASWDVPPALNAVSCRGDGEGGRVEGGQSTRHRGDRSRFGLIPIVRNRP